jgi:hypothetical protein
MSSDTLKFAAQDADNFFERHAWQALFGVSLIIGLFGVSDMARGAADLQSGERVMMQSITGTTWLELRSSSQKVANLIDLKFRTGGASLVTVALLSAWVCLRGFRRGERWAWYALWVLPLWLALTVFFFVRVDRDRSIGTPVPVISGSLFLIIATLALGLSARKFFKQPVTEAEAMKGH